jgi:SAM-dependent methyltransferase
MRPRIRIARFLIRAGKLIQSSALAVMRPRDLVEFNRQHYADPAQRACRSGEPFVASGLTDQERSLLHRAEAYGGRLLVLGLGGGRDAIALAKLGFEVTGVDFIPQMVELAEESAKRSGVRIVGLVQEISELNLGDSVFDVVWLSAGMYSCLPTRKRRVGLLKKISELLKPGGLALVVFVLNPQSEASPKSDVLMKLIARLTLGNRDYETGDMLRFDSEFLHAFVSVEELKAEALRAGLEVIDLEVEEGRAFAGAVLRKPLAAP